MASGEKRPRDEDDTSTEGGDDDDLEQSKGKEGRKGYIATDSPNHENIKYLTEKYNLTLVTYNEHDTILFGSTCKDVILSLGTFSWMLGLFSFYCENIYYMNPRCVKYWHGPIFEAFQNTTFSSSSLPLGEDKEKKEKYHCITLDTVR